MNAERKIRSLVWTNIESPMKVKLSVTPALSKVLIIKLFRVEGMPIVDLKCDS